MNTKLLFEQLIAKHNLNSAQMHEVISACMSGQLNDLQLATFLALMRMKGETVEELTSAAQVMQQHAHCIDLGADLVDIVGTGGDNKNTFNVSTACSFVVAAAGIAVAKHGNRSVSSRSGSADLLESAGIVLELSYKQIQECMQQYNLAFLFAPHYHPAMQHARAARQQLGIRTLFNLLGPLINPARVTKQVVGVYSSTWQKSVAEVLVNLGSTHSLVVSSADGMDEISIAAPTKIIEYKHGQFSEWQLNPKDYGMYYDSIDDIVVESPAQSLKLIEQAFEGELGAARDIILLNSAAAIYCARETLTFDKALEQSKESIDSGKAAACFNKLRLLTQQFK